MCVLNTSIAYSALISFGSFLRPWQPHLPDLSHHQISAVGPNKALSHSSSNSRLLTNYGFTFSHRRGFLAVLFVELSCWRLVKSSSGRHVRPSI